MKTQSYSIKDLEQLSGIKAHTIRIWEQRYKLLKPSRTETNIRFYSNDDLRKILNVALLLNLGFRISQVADMSEQELSKQLKLAGKSNPSEKKVNELVKAASGLDERSFNEIINDSITSDGMQKTIVNVIYPFLEKIGILWGTGDIIPAQEHFVSQLIRQKLFSGTDKIPVPFSSKKRVLLFLPEDELHDIPLLLSNYILRKKKVQTLFLGASVPLNNVVTAADIYKPTHLLTFLITRKNTEEVLEYFRKLQKNFPRQILIASGEPSLLSSLKPSKNLHVLKDPGKLQGLF